MPSVLEVLVMVTVTMGVVDWFHIISGGGVGGGGGGVGGGGLVSCLGAEGVRG